MNELAVECRELFRVHRTPEGDAAALQGLSLDVAAGESLCVLGPSGAGKSTLLRILAALEAPSAGLARVLGHDVARLSARGAAALRRDALGIVDQHAERALPPDVSAVEAIALPLTLRGVGRRVAHTRADELLERVGLRDAAGARPAELSGGERQRIACCAAVAHRPSLVLADEPTGELDAASAGGVLGLLGELAREHGSTLVVVSHDVAASAVADRTIRVRDGRVSDEARDGAQSVVVGRGGWLRVPEELLDAAGIGERAQVELRGGAVVISGSGGEARVSAGVNAEPVQSGAAPARLTGVRAELRGVAMAYGAGRRRRVVLEGVDAHFGAGTFTVVTGRSGSGKSTLLRILCGLESPDAGEVVIAGRPVGALDRASRAALRAELIAVVGQDPGLAPFLTATENIATALAWDGDVRVGEAGYWLDRLGLAERAGQRVSRLSAGERQRVAIARALAAGRGLVVVDEPTSRLDEQNARTVAALLRAAAHDHGATVVCATHEPILAAAADAELPLGTTPLSP